jgi:hypothetical protein
MIAGIAMLVVVGASLLQAGIARAQDIPGNATTSARLEVEVANPAYTVGEFETQGDSDWYRVRLEKGRHFFVAVGSGSSCLVRALVRNRAGRVLQSGLSDREYDAGFEFLAPVTNTFFVEYRPEPRNCFTVSPSRQTFDYVARVSTDCAGSLATTCVQRVGQTRRSMLAGAFDVDWFGATLAKARRYTVRAEALEGCAGDFSVAILDRSGATLAQGPFEEDSSISGFRPPSDGRYFLKVSTGDDCTVVYRLSLQTP